MILNKVNPAIVNRNAVPAGHYEELTWQEKYQLQLLQLQDAHRIIPEDFYTMSYELFV